MMRRAAAAVLKRRGPSSSMPCPTSLASPPRPPLAAAAALPSSSRRGLVTLPSGGRRSSSKVDQLAQLQSVSRRGVFTYPAPRKLSDIMKVPLVRKCEPVEIEAMWQEYHKERKDALAESIPASQFSLLKDRARASRVFLYPVFRDGGYMTLISQFQDSCFLFTFLEDFRKNPQAATPWMCLTLYDEFVADKGLGLLRGDVSHHLTRDEGIYLMTTLVEHYTHSDKFRTLHQFNHEPKRFSFESYVRSVKRPPPKPAVGDAGKGSPIILK